MDHVTVKLAFRYALVRWDSASLLLCRTRGRNDPQLDQVDALFGLAQKNGSKIVLTY